jgi:hypothetical protein
MTTTNDIVPADQFGAYIFTDDTNITSSSGAHLFYIDGSFDTLTATGANELVLAYDGHTTINLSGAGNNTIFVAGGNNTINAGHGMNSIFDVGGTGDTIVAPGAGGGFEQITLLGGANPLLDFAPALKGTNWDGKAADLGSYISATSAAGVTTVSLSTTAHGAATAVASVSAPGGTAWDPTTILSHVVT